MTIIEIKDKIIDYLINREGDSFPVFPTVDDKHSYLNNKIHFEITNNLPANPITPYFQLDSVDQIKWLLLEVNGQPEQKNIIFKVVDDYISSHNIDTTEKLFVSIF